MLEGTLLDDVRGRDVQWAGPDAAVSLSGEALTRASDGYRAYAALRANRPSPVAQAIVTTTSLEDHRASFEGICAAVAEAAGHLGGVSTRPLDAEIPRLFHGTSSGAAALRQYWLGLGFSPSEVDHYVAELANAGEGVRQIARAVQEGSDWREAVKQFGAGNPNAVHWGFGFSGEGEVHPTASAFATICRQAGVTPSLYVIMSIVLLLHKLADEVARE